MLPTLMPVLLAAATLGAPAVEPGIALTYRGTLVAQKGDAADEKKSFDVVWLATAADDAASTWCWTLGEQGRGAWPWTERFGRLQCDAQGRSTDAGPALLVEHAGGKSMVGLHVPVLGTDEPLRKDLTWKQDKLDYHVVGTQALGPHQVWRIEARNAYGLRRVVLVDQQRPVIRSYRERVFIGQGQEHELQVDLSNEMTLDAATLTKTADGFAKLLKLRDDLGLAPRTSQIQWNAKQLEILKANVPGLSGFKDRPLLTALIQATEDDVKNQRGRAGAVASLREKAIGQAVGPWKLAAVRGEGLETANLADQVTILHFWEYREAPLEEPYGQVGFLDFLFRKRQAEGVRVYGVVVTDPDSDADTRRRALQSAGRLKSFMNLSYPLLWDDGTVLKTIGDPRVAGGKLPLFVVIDRQGKVVEYYAGLYEVQRDRGLEDLNQIVSRALEKRE